MAAPPASASSRSAGLATAPDPNTRFQLTDMKARKAAPTRDEKKAAVTKAKPMPPKKSAAVGIGKRTAREAENEDEQPPSKKQFRAALKRSDKGARASSSNAAAPSCGSSRGSASPAKRAAADDKNISPPSKRKKANPTEQKAGEANESSNKSTGTG